jgi:hypothetical protein
LNKIVELHIFFHNNWAVKFFPINFYKLSLLKNLNYKIILLRISKLSSLLKEGVELGGNLFSRKEGDQNDQIKNELMESLNRDTIRGYCDKDLADIIEEYKNLN